VRSVLLLACLAIAAAGCGSSASGPGQDGAPTPADLAANATQALFEVGSAHYELDGSVDAQGDGMPLPTPITVHFEGDYSQEALTADGSVGFPGGNFSGGVLVGQHEFFLNLMGRWFGTRDFGLADAEAQMEKDDPKGAELYRELQTGDGVRRYFDRVFVGEVAEGPDADGASTWEFQGHLNADGIAALVAEYGGEVPGEAEIAAFRQIAEKMRFTLLVGRDDNLPRRFDFHLELNPEDFEALERADSGFDTPGTVRVDFALVLSDFGKEVEYEAPAQFEPLEKAVEAFFGNWE
jgi:hypothetical protein